MNKSNSQHRNDIYGDVKLRKTENAAIPAATVVLLRNAKVDFEVLMLRKNSKIAFGGMWVFPGGRIDDGDYTVAGDLEIAAKNAAVRETKEEAGIDLCAEKFVWISHWTPPASTPVRFSTWFFVAALDFDASVKIDDGEIKNHTWMSPNKALQRHTQGEIDLAPPTWVTLRQLSEYSNIDNLLLSFQQKEPEFFETHLGERQDGVRVAMWHGDAGYKEYNADASGLRHRLTMYKDGFQYERN